MRKPTKEEIWEVFSDLKETKRPAIWEMKFKNGDQERDWPYPVWLVFYFSVELKHQHLQKLSELFGTDNINLDFQRETKPYSDVTPGESAEFIIKVGEDGSRP